VSQSIGEGQMEAV